MPQTHTFKSLLPLVGVAFPMFIIDQLTKWVIQKNIMLHDRRVVIKGIFNIRHDTNNGAAFGFMPGQNAMLIIVTILAIALIFVYYRHFRDSLWMKIALGFLLGGALGNFADRIRFGAVIDFLQFGIENTGWWWPTFNVADVSVCIGAGMLIVHLIRNRGDYDAAKQVEN